MHSSAPTKFWASILTSHFIDPSSITPPIAPRRRTHPVRPINFTRLPRQPLLQLPLDLHWHITCCLNTVDDLRLYNKSGSIEKLPSLSHGMDRSRCHFLLSFRSFRRATRAAMDRDPASEPGGPGWAGRYLLCRGFRFADFGLSVALQ